MQGNKILTWLRSVKQVLAQDPIRLFWLFALAHLALWTIIPTLVCPNPPLDVIENYAWGREWLLGTHKHPPMQAWITEGMAVLTGRAPWAHYLASQLAVIIAFWAVWQTGRRMLGDFPALMGVLLLEGVVYYTFISPEFNANILQLPFWALIAWSFYGAVKDNKTTDWLLLGLWSAGGLYTKYSTVLLLVTLSILTLARPETRRRLRGKGPYLALLVAFVLFLPHLVWLVHHDYMPFVYAKDRLNQPLQGHIAALGMVFFALAQLLAVLPALLLTLSIFNFRSAAAKGRLKSFDRSFLHAVTFGPFVLTILLSMIMGFRTHDMWATPFWNFSGLWIIFRFNPVLSRSALRRFSYGWGIVFVATLTLYASAQTMGPYIFHKAWRVHFPGRALSDAITAAWHQRYHTPLTYIIGDGWPAGNVAYFAAERPHVVMMGDYSINPWADPAAVTREGGVLIWCASGCRGQMQKEPEPAFVRDHFPKAEMQQPLTLNRQTGADVNPVTIGWAILPPAPASP